MKQSILFGNGVNLLTEGTPSWDKLLDDISNIKIHEKMPNPLKYEAILLKQYKNSNWESNNASNNMLENTNSSKNNAKKKRETDLKYSITEKIQYFKSNDIIRRITLLPFDHYLTTNYDKSLFNEYGEKSIIPQDVTEKLYSARRRYILKNGEGERYYWPIHGICDKPASIMLGYDQYCGSLAKIESYVKGTYKYREKVLDSVNQRLKKELDYIYSWVDLFFITDIHIIGLGLNYEETDLWWLLNRRKRIKNDIHFYNKIYYYEIDQIETDKELLFNSFDVDVVKLKDKTLFNQKDNYKPRYESQLDEMEKIMNDRLKYEGRQDRWPVFNPNIQRLSE